MFDGQVVWLRGVAFLFCEYAFCDIWMFSGLSMKVEGWGV